MPVSNKHSDYTLFQSEWDLTIRAIRGPVAIEEQGEVYLPKTPAMKVMADGDDKYTFYSSFAEFPDFTGDALSGLVGLLTEKEATYELPKKLEPMLNSCTQDGMSLSDYHKHLIRKILGTGRYGILTDVDPDSKEKIPYFASYGALSIFNWSEVVTQGKKQVDMVVLDESGAEATDDDPFTFEDVEKFRVLRWDGATYTQEIYDGADATEPTGTPIVPKTSKGQFEEIPFVFAGSTDITPDVDDIPLLGMVRCAVSIYKKTASYGRALFISSDPQAVIVGIEQKDAPAYMGSGSIWCIPKVGGKAEFIGPDGNSIPYQREEIERKYREAFESGARLLKDKKAAESGEALKTRVKAQTATARSVAINTAKALEKSLRNAAIFVGANPDEVKVIPNLSWAENEVTPESILAFTQAKNQGAPFAKKSIHEHGRRGGLTTMSYEDEEALIEEEGPDFSMEGR